MDAVETVRTTISRTPGAYLELELLMFVVTDPQISFHVRRGNRNGSEDDIASDLILRLHLPRMRRDPPLIPPAILHTSRPLSIRLIHNIIN